MNTNLTTLNIPDSVYKIGYDAFKNSQWLKSRPTGLIYAGKVVLGYKGLMPNGYITTLETDTLAIAYSALLINQL